MTNLKFNPVYSFHDSAFVKEPADFSDKDRFIGEKSNRVKGINFDDIRIIVVETAMKIECVDAIEYSAGENIVSRSGHTL